MRLLVCGGRRYGEDSSDEALNVHNTLDNLRQEYFNIHIIQGGATGADRQAREWAEMNFIPFSEYPPNWPYWGKAAGPKRNQQMLDEGKPDLVIAFPGGRGTADMISRAEKAGVKVIKVD